MSHLYICFVLMTQRNEKYLEIEGYYDTGCKAKELAGVISGELDDYYTLGVEKEAKDDLAKWLNLSIKLVKRGSHLKSRYELTQNQLLHLT